MHYEYQAFTDTYKLKSGLKRVKLKRNTRFLCTPMNAPVLLRIKGEQGARSVVHRLVNVMQCMKYNVWQIIKHWQV